MYVYIKCLAKCWARKHNKAPLASGGCWYCPMNATSPQWGPASCPFLARLWDDRRRAPVQAEPAAAPPQPMLFSGKCAQSPRHPPGWLGLCHVLPSHPAQQACGSRNSGVGKKPWPMKCKRSFNFFIPQFVNLDGHENLTYAFVSLSTSKSIYFLVQA